MNASKLNKRIKFKDLEGNILFERYANVEPTAGRQYVSGLGIHADVTHVVTIRYDGKIDRNMLIEYNGRELEIDGPPINVKEENKWLKITCKEVV